MGRILALDIGEKRTGIAITDPMKIIAQPMELFNGSPDSEKFMKRLLEILAENQVERIIVGLPRNLKNLDTLSTQRARDAKVLIENAVDIPVEFWDERMTTAQSETILNDSGVNWRKQKEIKDKMAAALILENYLRYVNISGKRLSESE